MANKKKPYSKKSVNGEPNPHLKQSYTSGSEQFPGDSLIEYNQPESSPYESQIITIRVGSRTYRIPVCYIQNYPQFSSSLPWEPHYILSEVDDEVGHTVVHFLCTGNYETLRTASEPGVSKMAIEYRRSMLVYQAARKYDLYNLETYAKKYIEMFGESMSTFDRMEAAREIYSKLPQDETWLASYINKQLRIAFSLDKNIFQREEFYHGVGKDPVFDKAVMRMVVDIYSEILSRQVTETTPEEDAAEDCAAEDCAAEDGAAEEGAVEEYGAAEDGAAEKGSVEEYGAVEDGAAEEGNVEEDGAQEAVNLEVPAEPSGSTLNFEWGENWTSSSHLGLVSRDTGNRNMGKDTNLWYSKNEEEESVGFGAPYKEIKWKKTKGLLRQDALDAAHEQDQDAFGSQQIAYHWVVQNTKEHAKERALAYRLSLPHTD
ncbi:uncharacterized protein CDV56_108116 [Aspergillus thermomutatus]|uniref:BTB domain-containing protein n=1 Tax=Aspergillus thermomutatus TaxID=41047 RepID=A0A397HGT6_ASPTH|nr:uncharacterized protein CDV56_108116 [Aspergillus thermomutatus]RHZ60744.1 hypothetical protein CDV56_108116 [Aspergillus thermomutatus]